MKDDTLREALHRAAKGEPAVGDAFARFEVARRRNTIARAVVLVGLSVAIVLAFGFVFPNPLLRGDQGEVPVGGDLRPLPRADKVYTDSVIGYQLTYPARWDLAGREGGSVAFYIPANFEQPAFTEYIRERGTLFEQPATFYVRVTPDVGEADARFIARSELDRLADAGAIVTREDVLAVMSGRTLVDQLRVAFGGAPLPADDEDAEPVDYWCANCRVIEATMTLDAGRIPPLHLRIVAPNADLFNRHLFDATQILRSVERYIEGDRIG